MEEEVKSVPEEKTGAFERSLIPGKTEEVEKRFPLNGYTLSVFPPTLLTILEPIESEYK